VTQDLLPPDEISRRIRVGMWQIHDLFGELYGLFRLIHQALDESDAEIYPLASKGYLLPRDKKTSREADRYIKRDMGLLAAIGSDESDETEDEEPDDIGEGDDDAGDDDKRVVKVTPDYRFLGIRAILIDPKNRELEPCIVAGVFSSLTLTRRAKTAASQAEVIFDLKRSSLKKLVKALSPADQPGRTLTTGVPRGQATATVSSCHAQPLSRFRQKSDVDAFIDRVVHIVEGEPPT